MSCCPLLRVSRAVARARRGRSFCWGFVLRRLRPQNVGNVRDDRLDFLDISNEISTKRVCVKRSLLKRPARARSARARARRDRQRWLPSCVWLLLSYLLSCFSWSCRSCLHCSCCSVFSCFACNARRSLASRASRYMIARFFPGGPKSAPKGTSKMALASRNLDPQMDLQTGSGGEPQKRPKAASRGSLQIDRMVRKLLQNRPPNGSPKGLPKGHQN